MRSIIYVAGFIFILFVSCDKYENDKFRNDDSNTGFYNSTSVLNEPKELWKFKTNGGIYASLVSDEKSVYVGSTDSAFYSLNKITGKENWRFKTRGSINSTAIIKEKYTYFLSYDGYLYKLNKKNGKLAWKFKTDGENGHVIKDYFDPNRLVKDFWDFYQSSPVISDNSILFGCGKKFYSVDLNTGKEIWSFATEGSVHSSPAIKDNKILFGSFDSKMYCLDINAGHELWSYQTGKDTTYYVWLGVQASPAIEGDRVYLGSRDANIYCFDINSGDTLWTNKNFEQSWMPSSFAVGEKLYCGSSDGFSFYAIDKNSGNIDYRLKTNSYTFSSPAIDSQMAYIGSANGRLYGIDIQNQKIVWEFKTHGVLNDTLGVYNEKGELVAEEYKALGSKMDVRNFENYVKFYEQMFENYGAILSSPIVQEGIIYFGSADGFIYSVSSIK
ncbi:MAG TPA: hypothetical protein DCG75_11185 [Bacteroidales bacterium]|nr:hypothetical protein [Bacteroidales bacterium]